MNAFYEHIHFLSNLNTPPTPISIFNGIESYFKSNGFTVINKKNVMENVADKDIKENKHFNNIRTFKINLFKLVKFHEMSLMEFINGPGKCDLLELQRRYDMLTYICEKRGAKLPHRYC